MKYKKHILQDLTKNEVVISQCTIMSILENRLEQLAEVFNKDVHSLLDSMGVELEDKKITLSIQPNNSFLKEGYDITISK